MHPSSVDSSELGLVGRITFSPVVPPKVNVRHGENMRSACRSITEAKSQRLSNVGKINHCALDLIFSDHFSRHEPGVFAPLREMLLSIGETAYRALCGFPYYCGELEPMKAPDKIFLRSPPAPHRAIALAVVALAVPGCSWISRTTGATTRNQARTQIATRSFNTQVAAMRFADDFVDQSVRTTDTLAEQIGNAKMQTDILDWQLSQANAAVQIVSGPKPAASAVNMVVLVSLSRRIIERDWLVLYGEPAKPVLKAYERLERDAWTLMGDAVHRQRPGLDALLAAWVKDNPQVHNPSFVRFADFTTGEQQARVRAIPGLLDIVGLDPLSGMNPAVREVEQSRLLAERAVYYAQRLPRLLYIQGRLIAAQARTTPEADQVLGAFAGVDRLSASLTKFTDNAPALVSQQREAAIAQFMNELARQQQQMLGLATQLRAAIEAGHVTADSLNALIQSTDRLVTRFAPQPNAPRRSAPGKPFDINDYTRTIVELAATARDLQALVKNIDATTPHLADQVAVLTAGLHGLIGYALWRLIMLVMVILAAASMYRLVTWQLSRPRNS